MMRVRARRFAWSAALVGLATFGAVLGAAASEQSARTAATWAAASEERSPLAPVDAAAATGTLPAAPTQDGNVGSRASTRPVNPLWATPLSTLTATRQRPIFSPSRRAPAVREPPRLQAQSPAPTSRWPQLALLGAIAGESEGIAIFRDETTKGIVRLKTGESHSGWRLKAVKRREAILERNRETAVLAIPAPRPNTAP